MPMVIVTWLFYKGFISLSEMKNIFSGSAIKDDKFWSDMFASADINSDNLVRVTLFNYLKISLSEFKEMMSKLV